jgi:hypothetical protein
MKGILFKQYNVWKVEYEQIKGSKTIKKEIELHPDDVETIADDNEYANNFEFREVFFDIVLLPSKNIRSKIVAKLTQKEKPTIKIELKQNEDDV